MKRKEKKRNEMKRKEMKKLIAIRATWIGMLIDACVSNQQPSF